MAKSTAGYNNSWARRLRRAAIAGDEADHRGEIAAGAVAANGKARRVDAERGAVCRNPFGRGDAVLDRGREFVLGRQAVIDRDDRAAGGIGQMAAHRVVAFEIADDPAAAVEKDQRR